MPISVVYGVLVALASFGLLTTIANKKLPFSGCSPEDLRWSRTVNLHRSYSRLAGNLIFLVSVGALLGLLFR